jgi:hypothetical protein
MTSLDVGIAALRTRLTVLRARLEPLRSRLAPLHARLLRLHERLAPLRAVAWRVYDVYDRGSVTLKGFMPKASMPARC